MKYVFVNYAASMDFTDPESWLKRINAYTGILTALAVTDTVISIEHIDYEGDLVKHGVQYYFRRLTRTGRRLPLKLHRFIRSLKPDVVVVQSLHFPLQVIQLRLHLGSRPTLIVQNHAEQPFKGLKKQAQRLADNTIDAYLFASKEMGLQWVNQRCLFKATKVHEIMEVSSVFNPINKMAARSKTGIQVDQAFLWVGRLNTNKDPLTVVQAFLSYASDNPSSYLYMIYHTTELLDKVSAIITQHKAGKNIVLVGQLPHAELLYWFNSVDFIVSGSHYEGSGAAVCEAMSCGCIPIVTAIDSFKMMTNNGQCGLLYQPGDQQGLLEALKQTKQINVGDKRLEVLKHYTSTLSFKAIAGQFRSVAGGISR